SGTCWMARSPHRKSWSIPARQTLRPDPPVGMLRLAAAGNLRGLHLPVGVLFRRGWIDEAPMILLDPDDADDRDRQPEPDPQHRLVARRRGRKRGIGEGTPLDQAEHDA